LDVVPSPSPRPPDPLVGLFDLEPAASPSPSLIIGFRKVSTPADKGINISLGYSRAQNTLQLHFQIENTTGGTLETFAIKFNTNALGITNKQSMQCDPIGPGATGRTVVPLTWGPNVDQKPSGVQMALKIDKVVLYFQDSMPAFLLFDDDGKVERKEFPKMWSGIEQGSSEIIPNSLYSSGDDIKGRLEQHRVYFIAMRTVQERELSYYSASLRGERMLVEIAHVSPISCCVKSAQLDLSTHTLASIKELLTTRKL